MVALLVWQFRKGAREQAIHERLGLRKREGETKGHVIHLWRDGELVSTEVPGRVRTRSRIREFHQALGTDTPLSTLVLGVIGIMAIAALAGLAVTGSALVAAGFAAASVFPLWIFAQQRIVRKKSIFEQQLSDALALATQSLRAGHPLLGAFRLITEEMEPPISDVFAEILQLQSMGLSIEEAVGRVATQTTSEDMKLLAASIIIQTRSGGNLADMIDRLADVIRDRMRLYRRARVLTAQTQLSKYVLIAVPFFIFGSLHVLNADYISPLYKTTPGQIMSVVSAVLLLIGTYLINRIAVLKY
jgi:tight adherence protein B